MVTKAGLKWRGASGGFTLVELLLAVVLVLLLFGAVVFSFSTVRHGAELEEGARQFESLLRFARAHAANSGRQVQIAFDEHDGEGLNRPSEGLRVLWEPDSVDHPGLFEELLDAASYVRSINDLVNVEDVRNDLVDGERPVSGTEGGENAQVVFWPINFFPDGSADSAEVVLASRDGEDDRRVAVRLVGVTGSIRSRFVRRTDGSGEDDAAEEETESVFENAK